MSKNSNGGLLSIVSRKQQCLSLVKLCSCMKQLYQIHAHIQASGLHSDGFLVSEMLRFCALSPSGNLGYARSLLFILNDPIPPTASSWNFVIRGYTQSSCPREAVSVFVEMRRRRTRPNHLTFPFLLKASSHLSDIHCGKHIQADIIKNGLDSDIYVRNTLIRFYGSCQQIAAARRVFDEMSFRTVVSWNAILSGYVDNSLPHDCLALFAQMQGRVDETTMVVLLSACAELGNLSVGKWVHSHVILKGLVVNLQLGTALVNMYAKCGSINYALQIFDRMRETNVWTWSAMILGLAQHGLAKEALDLFQQLKNSSIEPNYVTFIGVLCACSHAGLVDQGYHFFRDMSHVHGMEPRMAHYSSMVDILGRSGRLEEAYKFITRMPVEPDAVVWRTLLSACSFHSVSTSGGIRENVKKRLLELEPKRSGNFVMVANMYAEAGMWEEVANVRRAMKDESLKKMAGESCVEVSGLIHRFVSGDDSRVDCEGIYWLLDGLNLHMKMVDYVDTSSLTL